MVDSNRRKANADCKTDPLGLSVINVFHAFSNEESIWFIKEVFKLFFGKNRKCSGKPGKNMG